MKKNIVLLILLISFSGVLIAKDVTDDRKILYIDEQIRFADGLVARGYYDLAIEEYIRLTKKFPEDPLAAETWIQLAEAYAAKSDFKSAIETFQTFFKKFPETRIVPAAKLKLALILHQSKDSANIDKAFSILSDLNNNVKIPPVIQDAASFYLGKLYLSDNKEDKAIAAFESISKKEINKSPEHDFRVSAVLELADLKSKAGKPDEAVKMLSALAAESELSPGIILKINWLLGETYFESCNYEKAAEVFAEFAILYPANSVTQDALYRRLQSLYMLKEYSRVISETDRLIKDGKATGRGWEGFYCIKSSALNGLKFYKGALESLLHVLNKSKDQEMIEFAAYKYAETQINNRNPDEACKFIQKYIADQKFSRKVIKDIVLLIADHAEAEAAEKLLRKSVAGVSSDSENADVLNLKLGAVLIRAGKSKEALKVYSELTSGAAEQFQPYAVMGEAQSLEQLGKNEEALDKYKFLMKKFHKHELYPKAMLRIAVLLMRDKKQWDTSKIYLAELIERFPDNPAAELAVFYQGYFAFYEKKYKDSKKILSQMLNDREIPPELKKDIQIYLLWSLIRLKDVDSAIFVFNSIKVPERLLEKGTTLFINELGTEFIDNNSSSAQLCFNELLKRKDKHNIQLGYIGSAKINIKNGDPVKAIEVLRKAVNLNADPKATSEAMIFLGNLLAERGKDDEAVLIFEKCSENPVDKESSYGAKLGLAKILAKQDDRLKAAGRYAMSVFILSTNKKICAEAMLLSIQISLKLNDRKSAETTWNEYKKRFPDMLKSEEVQRISRKLGK